MAESETLLAATAIVHEMARSVAPVYSPPQYGLPMKTMVDGRFALPGPGSDLKHALEFELSGLSSRIRYLEEKANTVNHQNLPDTPNEIDPTSPFGTSGPVGAARNGISKPTHRPSNSTRQASVSSILAGNAFTPEELGHLRDHVERQAREIKTQSETINEIKTEVAEEQRNLKRTFVKVENEDIGQIERELRKHQQANAAFQKILKEIGIVITAVANGDLGQKVQIHAKEMDEEIVSFKRTINTMMDQLQLFAGEVSRVAREVGTEGKLGGQAQITGVSGIWADLTNNGISNPRSQLYQRLD